MIIVFCEDGIKHYKKLRRFLYSFCGCHACYCNFLIQRILKWYFHLYKIQLLYKTETCSLWCVPQLVSWQPNTRFLTLAIKHLIVQLKILSVSWVYDKKYINVTLRLKVKFLSQTNAVNSPFNVQHNIYVIIFFIYYSMAVF